MNPMFNQLFWPFSIFICLLFITGLYCILATFNLLRAIIGVEIMIKGVTLLIILVGYITGNMALAQALVITLIVVEVVIMVVAGGVILCIFKHNQTIDTRKLNNLKG
ncbi:MAG: NADH-quinone oxidoreductase subunit K [Candidatus Omnitrophota bacterium]|jgi:multisubunit Na+/H+ antiporter MnhC subunit